MALGLVGRKAGMTEIFEEDGNSMAVTVIEIFSNNVSQIKTQQTDGYDAVQIAFGQKRTSQLTKPVLGHLKKAGIESSRGFHEFRVGEDFVKDCELGHNYGPDVFELGQFVQVQGVTKGKGFQGGVKRHNFSMQDATHGNSVSHRAIGSTGMCQTPGRVFKGKKMPGQMGNVVKTVKNQKVVEVDVERRILIIAGTVPGATGGIVIIHPELGKKAK